MELLIVTGMSGSGKSTALNILEDLGYYCIDNFPLSLIEPLLMLLRDENSKKKIALTIDVRNFDLPDNLKKVIGFLDEEQFKYSIMFLYANKNNLLRRYKETRRRHPLMKKSSLTLEEAIDKEKEILQYLRGISNFVIDTSDKLVVDFKEQVVSMLSESDSDILNVNFVSFGFKYGTLADADLIFDLRCLPNPYYNLDLRAKTGEDQEVEDYVMKFPESKTLYTLVEDYLKFTIPLYKREGKSQLVVAFGCTGGKHRSTTFAKRFTRDFELEGINKIKRHRDIEKK